MMNRITLVVCEPFNLFNLQKGKEVWELWIKEDDGTTNLLLTDIETHALAERIGKAVVEMYGGTYIIDRV